MAPGMRLGSDDEEIKAAYSCAAAHSGKRLRSDENQASVLNACSGVVCIACDLFNKLAVDLEDLVVGAVKVHTVGKISQCLVAHPTKDWAFPVRHPELYTIGGRQVVNVPLQRHRPNLLAALLTSIPGPSSSGQLLSWRLEKKQQID
jgi:hypothetical protein